MSERAIRKQAEHEWHEERRREDAVESLRLAVQVATISYSAEEVLAACEAAIKKAYERGRRDALENR